MSLLFDLKVLKKLEKLEVLLARMYYKLALIEDTGENMSAELDQLTVDVSEMSTVVDSAIVLLEGLSARLLEIANDPAAIKALSVELDSKSAALADAVVANTPVEPVEPTP